MVVDSRKELMTLLGCHIDPQKDEQLKKTKTEIDDKVAKVIKLVRSRNQRKKGGNSSNLEIVELVEDFHKQYLSLYELHDNLIEDLREKVYGKEDEEEDEGTYHNADVDSFFSADEISISSSPGNEFIRRVSDDITPKSEIFSTELVDLKNKLVSMSEEKDALHSDYMASLNKVQESEGVIKDLKIEAEQTESGKQKLSDEYDRLKEKAAECEKELVSLKKDRQVQESKAANRVKKLEAQKRELEEKIEGKASEAKELGEENTKLQTRILELEKVFQEKEDSLLKKLEKNESDSISKIDIINQELSNFRSLTEELKQKLESSKTDLHKLQEEKVELEGKKNGVEIKMENKIRETDQLRADNEELHDRISQLEKLEMKRGDELAAIQALMTGLENDSSVKIKSSEAEVKKMQQQMKLNLKIIERKIDDTAEGFFKKFEDNIRILSRRIRVAEQLHMENKDIYMKTKEKYEKEHKGFKDMIEITQVAIKRMKGISFTANEVLDKSNAAALKFNEQSEHFLNRISKASCEVLFVKDWVRRKNNAIKNFQEDADELLGEMGKKESEILGLRERVWKSENRVRELEKIVKEKEDGMLSVGEEKREAIRQLCVWIDYHRSRSDSLKKILSDMTAARRQRIA